MHNTNGQPESSQAAARRAVVTMDARCAAEITDYCYEHHAEVERAVNPLRRTPQSGSLVQHAKAVQAWLTMSARARITEERAYAATQLYGMGMEDARTFVNMDVQPVRSDVGPFKTMLGIEGVADIKEVLKRLGALSQPQALEIIQAAFPSSVRALGQTIDGAIIGFIQRRLGEEGVQCYASPRYTLGEWDEMKRAVTDLFQAAGFPSLDGLNADERREALQNMPRKLAEILVTHAPMHSGFSISAISLFGVYYQSDEWCTMVEVAKERKLEDLAKYAVPRPVAWRKLCDLLDLNVLQNRQNDPVARTYVAMEAVARENIPDSLLFGAGLNGITKSAQIRVDAWRELANIVGRPDLARGFADDSLRQLTQAAKAYAALHGETDPEIGATIANLLLAAQGEKTKGREIDSLAR